MSLTEKDAKAYQDTLDVENILADFFLKKFEMRNSRSDYDEEHQRKSKHKKHKKSKHKLKIKSRSSSPTGVHIARKVDVVRVFSSEEKDIKRLKKIKNIEARDNKVGPYLPALHSTLIEQNSSENHSSLVISTSGDIDVPYGPSLELLLSGTELNKIENESGTVVSPSHEVEACSSKEKSNLDEKGNISNVASVGNLNVDSEVQNNLSQNRENLLNEKAESTTDNENICTATKDSVKVFEASKESESLLVEKAPKKEDNKCVEKHSHKYSRSRSRSKSKTHKRNISPQFKSIHHSRSRSGSRYKSYRRRSYSRDRSDSKERRRSRSKKSWRRNKHSSRSRSRSAKKSRSRSKESSKRSMKRSSRSRSRSAKRSRESSKQSGSRSAKRSQSKESSKRSKKHSSRSRSRSAKKSRSRSKESSKRSMKHSSRSGSRSTKRSRSKESSKRSKKYSSRSRSRSAKKSRSRSKESSKRSMKRSSRSRSRSAKRSRESSKRSKKNSSRSQSRSAKRSRSRESSKRRKKNSSRCQSRSAKRSRSKSKESSRRSTKRSSRSRSRSAKRSRSKSKESSNRGKRHSSRSQSKSAKRSGSKESTKRNMKHSPRSRSRSAKRSRSKSKESSKRNKRHSSGSQSRSAPRHRRRTNSRSYSRDRYKSKRTSRNRYRSRSHSREHSNSRSRRKSSPSSRSRSKKDSKSKRSRSKSREKNSDSVKSNKIDQAKILQIAQKNVLTMIEKGTLPEGLSLDLFKKEQLVSLKSGGKSVQELTDFCVKLSEKENESNETKPDSASDANNQDGDSDFIHHPFKLKEQPMIKLNIKNAVQIPIKTHAEKFAETAKLSSQFPVSSGNQHKQKELEWIPVVPDKSKSVQNVAEPKTAVSSAPKTEVTQETVKSESATPTPVSSTNTILHIPLPTKTVPALAPPPLPPLLPPPPPSPLLLATSTPVSRQPDLSSNIYTVPTPSVSYPAPSCNNPFSLVPNDPVLPSTETELATSSSSAVSSTTFKPTKHIDISSIVTKRFKALTKLQADANDALALQTLHEAQSNIQEWVESQQVPGLFTGSTDAKLLTVEELCGPKNWNYRVKRDIFTRAAPVTEGKGMSLLKKMGWNPGEGLGKNKEGSLEPLLLDVKTDKKGLVSMGESGKRATASVVKELQGKHPVSALMELCSKRKWKPPLYNMVKDQGPPHKKIFLFKVEVNGVDYLPATPSPNKKVAKADAAVVCLQALNVFPK